MKGHQERGNHNAIWLTPPAILDALGEFDLDPCSAPSPRPWATAKRHIELPEDGLLIQWEGRVWMNPPFQSNLRPLWMERMATHGNGIMLIPAATETLAFRRYVWEVASSVLFLKTRPNYCFPDGSKSKANSGSAMVLVGYGAVNDGILRESKLGVFVDRWHK